MIYAEMLWVMEYFHVAQGKLSAVGVNLIVDLRYLKESQKDTGTKLLVVKNGKKKGRGNGCKLYFEKLGQGIR